MSELRESEEAKLEKILGLKPTSLTPRSSRRSKSPRPAMVAERERAGLNLTDRSSIQDAFKQVLDRLDIESGSDFDDDSVKLDEFLDRSSSQSPARRRPQRVSGSGKLTKPLDKSGSRGGGGGGDVKQRKVSPIVQREKEMQARREAMQEKFAERRERDAKRLLKEMLSDEVLLPTTIG